MTAALDHALRDRLAELRRAIAAARVDGDLVAEAELQGEAAAVHTGLRQFEEAKKRLARAGELQAGAGDAVAAARSRYGIALLELRNPARSRQARTELTAALEVFRARGEHEYAARALAHLAALDIGASDLAGAEAAFAEAAAAHAAAGHVGEQVESLRLQAQVMLLAGRDADALGLLGRAIETARDAGLGGTVAALRLDRRVVAGPAGEGEDRVAAILEAAIAEQRPEIAGRAHLARAGERAQEGDLPGALADAEAARQGALESVDPVGYAMACLQLAELHELGHDRLAAVTVLLTCQASLGELLGDDARAPILLVLDSLEARWGEVAFDEVLAEYRARQR